MSSGEVILPSAWYLPSIELREWFTHLLRISLWNVWRGPQSSGQMKWEDHMGSDLFYSLDLGSVSCEFFILLWGTLKTWTRDVNVSLIHICMTNVFHNNTVPSSISLILIEQCLLLDDCRKILDLLGWTLSLTIPFKAILTQTNSAWCTLALLFQWKHCIQKHCI